jgi:hypothetical protein
VQIEKQKGRKNKNGKSTREPSNPGTNAGQCLPLKQVKEERCPECPYKTAFCEFMMRIHMDGLADKGFRFVCQGMRHWITKNN